MRERIGRIVKLIVRRSVVIAGTAWLAVILLVLPAIGIGVVVQSLETQITGGGAYTTVRGDEFSENRILAIPVKGPIDGTPADAENPDPSIAYGYTVADQLAKAADDDSVKAVVLVIDSPGGTIYGARAIAEGVEAYRKKTKNPVVTQVAGAADSGAYWAAASTDMIVADYGTDVGSIGVISGPFRNYTGVTSVTDPIDGQVVAGNISSLYITAGTGKDEGDPFRKLTSEEQANLQLGVNNDYAAFVEYVAARRHISAETIRNKVGAYSYDPATALTLKLIDKIGGRDVAFAEAASRAKLKADDYQVVSPSDAASSPPPTSGTSASACHLKGRLAAAVSLGCYNR